MITLKSKHAYIMIVWIIQVFFLINLQANKENLVDIRKINQNIRVDLRYATSKNFAGEPLFECPGAFLHIDAAKALDSVQKDLEKQGYGLLVWDAYRSNEMQQKMWVVACKLGGNALLHVSNPATSPGYKNRGVHVELTLINKNGMQLEMPTDFDDLGENAHSKNTNFSQKILDNRKILHDVMTKHGFSNFKLEWWYFQLKNWKDYPPFEVSLKELKDMAANPN